MDLLYAASANILQPAILFFVLGIFCGAARIDLALPAGFSRILALYLMAAIGLKGGSALALQGMDASLVLALAAGAVLSAGLPFVAYGFLRRLSAINTVNAAAIAAHYGSVSVVTFAAGVEMLDRAGMPYEGYMPAVLAIMETPAIVSGLFIAHRFGKKGPESPANRPGRKDPHAQDHLRREVFLNASVVMLIGAFVIGYLSGGDGMEQVGPLFGAPFKGVLCLYLLDTGITVAQRLAEAEGTVNRRLIAFGVLMPLIGAGFGAAVASLIGLSVGGAALMIVLAASASYIAVPAAMKIALPQSNPALYMVLSLGITFPFNIVLGLPLYFALARLVGAP